MTPNHTFFIKFSQKISSPKNLIRSVATGEFRSINPYECSSNFVGMIIVAYCLRQNYSSSTRLVSFDTSSMLSDLRQHRFTSSTKVAVQPWKWLRAVWKRKAILCALYWFLPQFQTSTTSRPGLETATLMVRQLFSMCAITVNVFTICWAFFVSLGTSSVRANWPVWYMDTLARVRMISPSVAPWIIKSSRYYKNMLKTSLFWCSAQLVKVLPFPATDILLPGLKQAWSGPRKCWWKSIGAY